MSKTSKRFALFEGQIWANRESLNDRFIMDAPAHPARSFFH